MFACWPQPSPSEVLRRGASEAEVMGFRKRLESMNGESTLTAVEDSIQKGRQRNCWPAKIIGLRRVGKALRQAKGDTEPRDGIRLLLSFGQAHRLPTAHSRMPQFGLAH